MRAGGIEEHYCTKVEEFEEEETRNDMGADHTCGHKVGYQVRLLWPQGMTEYHDIMDIYRIP